jgi:hypothetical protein
MRWQSTELTAIDAWRRKQEDLPSRTTAIRRLVEQALALASDNLPTNERKARKAAELAGRAVEAMGNQLVPAEERQRRKRALIKGPKEFREIREDLPKPKKGS